jgi:hypothetical protein
VLSRRQDITGCEVTRNDIRALLFSSPLLSRLHPVLLQRLAQFRPFSATEEKVWRFFAPGAKPYERQVSRQ